MRNSNIAKKAVESSRRKRQKEIVEIRSVREAKKKLWEVITAEDFHKSWHLRHRKF